MRFPCICGLVILASVTSCKEADESTVPLRIATAANMQYVMEDIVDAFKKKETVQVEVIVGSSGKLTAQSMQGAPYHVLVSADIKYPKLLSDEGRTLEKPKVYAHGKLSMWTMEVDLDLQSVDLASDRIKKIAIANPKTAPYGAAALEYLEQLNDAPLLKDKLIFGENIAQVNQFVSTGAVDIGITAYSSKFSKNMEGKGKWARIDTSFYNSLEQGIVILNSNHPSEELGKKFKEFILSTEGQRILTNHGYSIPSS